MGDRNTRYKNSSPLKWDYLGISPKMGKGGSSQSQNHTEVLKQVFPKGEMISDQFDHLKVIGFDPILELHRLHILTYICRHNQASKYKEISQSDKISTKKQTSISKRTKLWSCFGLHNKLRLFQIYLVEECTNKCYPNL